MKFTFSWLKKFLDTEASLEQILDKLIQLGLEVEEVINQIDIYKDFVVAEIISAIPHPEADKLRICQVNNGQEILQIVCGAPNARAGIKVVLAPIGTEIPNSGIKIKESKIRNVLSNGMLCSGKELNLSEDAAGILELNDTFIVGQSFATSYGLNEILIDVSITPNRGDCLGIYGIARDLSATGIGKLKSLNSLKHEKGTFSSPIHVKIENSKICSKYIGRYFRNVKNCSSPEWLQHSLKSVGLKPISALVDITNYFTIAFGRPLHVYDADLINEITLRKATLDEKFVALNDKEYCLTGEEYVLADQKQILSLPGIIGGKESGVYLDSKNIFLEIGLFDTDEVVKTSRIHQIDTDAKHRFERKVDPEFLVTALDLATEMITEVCGGEPSEPIMIDHYNYIPSKIELRLDLFKRVLGIEYSKNKIETILTALGFTIDTLANDVLEITVPSWRNDIRIKEDIVEEIARIDGYNNIPSTPLLTNTTYPILDLKQRNIYRIQRFAASLGLDEVITWSFMSSKKAALFSELKKECFVKNPISSELDYMRSSILPNLLEAAYKNQNRKMTNLGLFELASIFKGSNVEDQVLSLSGLRIGYNNERNIYQDHRKFDSYDAKADMLAILAEIGFDSNKFQYKTENIPKYYHPGRSAVLTLGKSIIGYFGEIHPRIIKSYDLNNNAVGFEIFLDNIPFTKPKFGRKGMAEISDYQMVERDFAFLVNSNIVAEQIIRSVMQVDKKLIKDINIFDIYQGKNIDSDKKSIAFTVTLQAMDHTLSEQEIEQLSQKIIESVQKNTNAVLRSI